MQKHQGYYGLTWKAGGAGQENPLRQKRKSSNCNAGLSLKTYSTHMPQDLSLTPLPAVLSSCSVLVPNHGERAILLSLVVSSSQDLGKSDQK